MSGKRCMARIFTNAWRGDPCRFPAKFRVQGGSDEPAKTVCGIHVRWYRLNSHLYTVEPL